MGGVERGEAARGARVLPDVEEPPAGLVEGLRLLLALGDAAERRDRQAARATETPDD